MDQLLLGKGLVSTLISFVMDLLNGILSLGYSRPCFYFNYYYIKLH